MNTNRDPGRVLLRHLATPLSDTELAMVAGGQTVGCGDAGQVETLTAVAGGGGEGCDDPVIVGGGGGGHLKLPDNVPIYKSF